MRSSFLEKMVPKLVPKLIFLNNLAKIKKYIGLFYVYFTIIKTKLSVEIYYIIKLFKALTSIGELLKHISTLFLF